jgi:regulator of replication initiation timing
MNKNIEQQLSNIKQKLLALIAQNDVLHKENIALKNKLDFTNINHVKANETIEVLQQKIQALNLLSTNMEDADKKELSKKIDQYLKDINKTITILSE